MAGLLSIRSLFRCLSRLTPAAKTKKKFSDDGALPRRRYAECKRRQPPFCAFAIENFERGAFPVAAGAVWA
jgi:hypothetical protein